VKEKKRYGFEAVPTHVLTGAGKSGTPGGPEVGEENKESHGTGVAMIAESDGELFNRLYQELYQELYDLAWRLMRRERRDHSWGATDLVHEAYLKLARGTLPTKNRAYIFGAAAQAMRRLLVDRARQTHNKPNHVPLDDLVDRLEKTQQVSMEDLDKALAELGGFAPREHQVVMLRIFGGLSVAEVAELLEVCASTVEKDWKWARTWLYRRLRGDKHDA
jgi:RNA polymerase sigma factor (TIGR02999 family)